MAGSYELSHSTRGITVRLAVSRRVLGGRGNLPPFLGSFGCCFFWVEDLVLPFVGGFNLDPWGIAASQTVCGGEEQEGEEQFDQQLFTTRAHHLRMRDVRVCLVGDEGVGKSTIISSLIKSVAGHFFCPPLIELDSTTVSPGSRS